MKIITGGTKFILQQKGIRRLLLTAVAAFLMMLGTDSLASFVREMIAYHTVGTYVVLFVGINTLLSRRKLKGITKRLKNLWAMGESDEKAASPIPVSGNASVADIAREFVAAVNNGAPEEEEVFED